MINEYERPKYLTHPGDVTEATMATWTGIAAVHKIMSVVRSEAPAMPDTRLDAIESTVRQQVKRVEIV